MSSIAAPRSSVAVPLLVLVIAGCVIAAVTNGIRTTFGLFTLPMTADLGVSREAWDSPWRSRILPGGSRSR